MKTKNQCERRRIFNLLVKKRQLNETKLIGIKEPEDAKKSIFKPLKKENFTEEYKFLIAGKEIQKSSRNLQCLFFIGNRDIYMLNAE